MVIKIDQFDYAVPKLSPKLLGNSQAQYCLNCNLESKSIKPIAGLYTDTTLTKEGDLRSIYQMDDEWIAWEGDIDVVKAQILDSDHRIFYTGDGYPKQTNETLATGATGEYPQDERRLGVQPPTAALVLETQGSGDGESGKVVSYVYTYVDEFGNESAPSPPTGVTTLEGDQYARVKNFVLPVLATTGNDIKYYRLYRLETSEDANAEYQLIKSRPVNLSGTPTYDIDVDDITTTSIYVYDANDSATPDDLTTLVSEVLPTEDWAIPPESDPSYIAGLIQYQNGVLAAFYKNNVVVSEAFYPYAWPTAYFRTSDYDIVGLGINQQNIIVLTESYPYVLQGYDPNTMIIDRLPFKQPCLSKRGIVSTPFGVLYPTPDGLGMINGTDFTNITEGIYSKRQWNALSPDDFVSFYYNRKYIAFASGTSGGISIDLDTGGATTLSVGKPVYGGYIDPIDDALYLLIYDDPDYKIVKYDFNDLAYLTYEWESKTFETPTYTNFSCAQIKGAFTGANSVTFKLYADGTLKETKTVNSDDVFRLSGGYQAREWVIDIQGNVEVESVGVANSVEELKNV